jgi:hypothetical protein
MKDMQARCVWGLLHCFGKMYLLGVVALHCKLGEVYTRLITATCVVGPGTTHMCTFEICVWSLQILEIADKRVFHNSIF